MRQISWMVLLFEGDLSSSVLSSPHPAYLESRSTQTQLPSHSQTGTLRRNASKTLQRSCEIYKQSASPAHRNEGSSNSNHPYNGLPSSSVAAVFLGGCAIHKGPCFYNHIVAHNGLEKMKE